MITRIEVGSFLLRISDTKSNCIFINIPGPRYLRFGCGGLEIVNTYESDLYEQIHVMGVDEI
jgi:hypothetical protein